MTMVSARPIPFCRDGKYFGMRPITLALTLAFATQPHPPAFEEMAEAERAFARRAQEVSVHQAFMEYFADDAVGFDTGRPASAGGDAEAPGSSERPEPVVLVGTSLR